MTKQLTIITALTATLVAGTAHAQYPIMDRVASKVIEKYQTSSCQQLWQEKDAQISVLLESTRR